MQYAELFSDFGLILRLLFSVQLAICAVSLFIAHRHFENHILTRILRIASIWFVLMAVIRSGSAILDFLQFDGYGVVSLASNVVLWTYPTFHIARLAVKMLRGTLPSIVTVKTDEFFDDAFRDIRENIRKTEDLHKQLLNKRLTL